MNVNKDDTLEVATEWFRKCYPTFTHKNVTTQVGVHFEEVAEMLEELDSNNSELQVLLINAEKALIQLATALKTCDETTQLLVLSRVGLLDSLADQAVTASGSAYMLNMNLPAAMVEVNRSNFSKFDKGVVIKDENLKVKKSAEYTPPDLTPYV